LSAALLAGVRVTGPTAVGVIVNVCAAAELLKVSTMAEDRPPPEGVIVMVPVNAAIGVTVKLPEEVLSAPPDGPVNVKPGTTGVTTLEAPDAALVPNAFVAVTEQV